MNLDKVKEIIAEQLGVGVEEVTDNASLKDDLNADSLDLFQIVMSLEEEYNLEIPTEDVESIATISDIAKYIESKVN